MLQAPAAPTGSAPGEAASASAQACDPRLSAAVVDGLAGAATTGLIRHESGAQLLVELVMTLPQDTRGERLQAVLRRLTRPHARVDIPAEGCAGRDEPGSQAAVAAVVGMLQWPRESAEPDAVVSAALQLPNSQAASSVLAAALARLPPEESVPRLVRALGAAAGGTERAAASELLLAVLSASGNVVGALQALLQAVRGSGKVHTAGSASAGTTGGGSEAGQPGVADTIPSDAAAEHAADVLRTWGERVGRAPGAALAPALAAEVLRALWAAPADGTVVKMLAALGGFFAEHPAPLLAGIRLQLAQQPVLPDAGAAGPSAGSERLPGPASAQGHAGRLFERLVPLIALRTLPAAALEAPEAAGYLYSSGEAAASHPGDERQAAASSSAAAATAGTGAATAQGGGTSTGAADAQAALGPERRSSNPLARASAASDIARDAGQQERPQPGSIAAALLQRMASAGELPEVRRQAAELMGRMAGPGAERAVGDLVSGGAKSGDTLALRAGLFATCAALSARGARALALRDGGALLRVLRAVASVLRWPQVRAISHFRTECVDMHATVRSRSLLIAAAPWQVPAANCVALV